MISRKDNPKFLSEFLDYSGTIQNKSRNTISEYNYDLRHFFQFLVYRYNNDEIIASKLKMERSSKPISMLTIAEQIKLMDVSDLKMNFVAQITLQDIHSFLHHLKNEFDSKAPTLARKVASIRSFFNYYCTIRGNLENNPTVGLETPKKPKVLPKYLDLSESKDLITTAGVPNSTREHSKNLAIRNVAIISLFLNLGLRLSELVGINISDINFYDNSVRVLGKGNKERTIYLNKTCINSIKAYLDVRPEASGKDVDALFLSSVKKRISQRAIQQMLEVELKKAGISGKGITPHKLRHTAATLMYQYGEVDIRALQKVLGHASISTTEIYTHINNEHVKDAISRNPLSDM